MSVAAKDIAWIAVDWGTSNLRVWGMDNNDRSIAQAQSTKGMSTLAKRDFEGALIELIEPWLDRRKTVIACGMLGARQGWAEAKYAKTPCTPLGAEMTRVDCDHPNLSVHIIPGVQQDKPADVMRGEETQVAGFLALNPKWDGVICLPGTHTKWVHVSAGEIVSFQTFMTGEIYAFLRHSSVLSHSLQSSGWDDDAFADGLSEAMSKPESIAAKLFQIRASDLLNATPAEIGNSRLSGLLLGAELAATRAYWLGQQVAVVGSEEIAKPYRSALSAQGVPVIETNSTSMTLAGLSVAHSNLKATT